MPKVKLKQFDQSGAADSDRMVYNATSGLWEPYKPAYGGISGENQSGLTAALTATFVVYTQYERNLASLNATSDHTNDRVTVDNAGDYLFQVAGGIESTVAATTLSIELHVSGARTFCGCRIYLAGINQSIGFAASCVQSLVASAYVDLRIRQVGATGAQARIRDSTLSVLRVG